MAKILLQCSLGLANIQDKVKVIVLGIGHRRYCSDIKNEGKSLLFISREPLSCFMTYCSEDHLLFTPLEKSWPPQTTFGTEQRESEQLLCRR